ncbi:hypothetical protein, partial [Dolichospermum sp. LEGE 00240]|uniref:hypothetical protein n=1 Tax=Dolichospermum sp. LEGE 00240 TaxID=1828603 RepID=UPI001D143E16
LFLSSLLAPKLVKISNPLKIILKTRIGLIYSFKVLFFLGSVAWELFFSFGTYLTYQSFLFLSRGLANIFLGSGLKIAESIMKLSIQGIFDLSDRQ